MLINCHLVLKQLFISETFKKKKKKKQKQHSRVFAELENAVKKVNTSCDQLKFTSRCICISIITSVQETF